MPPIVIKADRRDNGQTLAAVLKTRLNLSWSKAKQTIERRHVRVSGQIVADGAYRVKAGKRITIAEGTIEQKAIGGVWKPETKPEKKPKPRLAPTSTASKRGTPVIVYSDDAVVVVDKPPGLTTMRHAEEAAEFGKGKKFLPNTLMDQLPKLMGEPGIKLFAVHRIDKDTSGLVVFARTLMAAKFLAKQFKSHVVERKYLALTRGRPNSNRIETTIVDDRGDGRRGSAPDGKPAITHVTVKQPLGDFALVECTLETGRTHQVRIHLGESGAPLCGEKVYDRPLHGKPLPDASGAKRPMLHAASLGFLHPETREKLLFQSELPSDFQVVMQRLQSSIS